MRALHLSLSYKSAPQLGGPDTTVFKLCSALKRQGVIVDVICTNLASKNSYLSKSSFTKVVDGVNVSYLRTMKLIPLGQTSFGLFYLPELKKQLGSQINRYDIVHVHGFRDYLSWMGTHQAVRHKVPYILHPRGTLPYQGHSILAKSLFDSLYGKAMIKRAAGLIALTNREIESYRKLNADINKINVINNGIDEEDYDPSVSGEAFRQKHNIAEKFIVMYLGRIHKIKGIDHMVRAVAKLSETGLDVAAVVVGPDEGYGQELFNIANKQNFTHFYMIPTVSGYEKQQAFGAADVLVYAAEVEDFGVVAFEGILSGVPTIVASETGCGEVTRNLNAGYTITYGNVLQLTLRIKEILSNLEIAKAFTLQARYRVIEYLGWDDIATKVITLYQKII